MRRLLRAAAALAGLALVVKLARRLTATSRPKGVVAPSGLTPGGPPPTGRPGPSAAAPGPTRRQLYDQARRLDIKGRSRMSKATLSQAVTEAREGGS